MLKQIKRLTVVGICNFLRINETIHSKDPKKKRQLLMMGILYLLLGAMMGFYVGMLSYAYIFMGMGEIIPVYMAAVVSLVIIFFSIFKTGNTIFQMETYEMLSAMPVTPAAIVTSRFLCMYLGNLILSALVMISGLSVYAVLRRPGPSFYIMGLVGIFFLPLLPMTLAMTLGAIITAVSSRAKHKNLASIVLSVTSVVLILLFSMQLSFQADTLTEAMFSDLSVFISDQINRIYPPAFWFGSGMTEGNYLAFLLFAGASLLVFLIFVYIVQKNFLTICTALRGERARGNYKMQELMVSKPLIALYRKERKRYFSSSIYVVNTLCGYLMMMMAAAGLVLFGVEKMEEMLMMPGITGRVLPYLLAGLAAMTSTTSCSISIEGKQWWIVKSLPVPTKMLFDSKILVHLTIALPCYLVTELLLFGVPFTFGQRLAVILVPLAYILFAAVSGITINAKMPFFDWKTEMEVVKQGGAVFFTMIIAFGSILLPVAAVFIIPNETAVMIFTFAVVSGITLFLYRKNSRMKLNL